LAENRPISGQSQQDMTMTKKLYGWMAKRAGAGITIVHSTGKVTDIESITLTEITNDAPALVARRSDGEVYELVTTTMKGA
jgi:hypothetical protein